ncbi:MAG: flagellar hook-basal body complex protein [Oscillospiraceae bacterium]|jgi:flagellar hook protein FlgE|nr:flagellar hook-basal body complex protein [Oscillospiraceae bacterium]
MMRSLYSGISGLKNHQTRMDVIGNNIANVNTAGFKASRTIFQDIYSQTSRSAAAPVVGGAGGTNPMQIGLGVKLATIDVLHTPAAIQRTDRELDAMIEGDGFFAVSETADAVGDTAIYYTRAGNFYLDSDGNLVTASGMYVRGVMGDGSVVDIPDGEIDEASLGTIIITPGTYSSIAIDPSGVIQGIDAATGAKVQIAAIAVATFINPSGLEKMGDSLYAATPNSGAVGGDPTAPMYYQAGTNGAGKINPGGLEMSNVDIATEFTDMIVTQRGFQANSRIITVSDTLLEELVNLKR